MNGEMKSLQTIENTNAYLQLEMQPEMQPNQHDDMNQFIMRSSLIPANETVTESNFSSSDIAHRKLSVVSEPSELESSTDDIESYIRSCSSLIENDNYRLVSQSHSTLSAESNSASPASNHSKSPNPADMIPRSTQFQCNSPGCNKTFTTSGHLSRHKKIHSGIKDYFCPIPGCNRSFIRRDNMIQHAKSHQKRLERSLFLEHGESGEGFPVFHESANPGSNYSPFTGGFQTELFNASYDHSQSHNTPNYQNQHSQSSAQVHLYPNHPQAQPRSYLRHKSPTSAIVHHRRKSSSSTSIGSTSTTGSNMSMSNDQDLQAQLQLIAMRFSDNQNQNQNQNHLPSQLPSQGSSQHAMPHRQSFQFVQPPFTTLMSQSLPAVSGDHSGSQSQQQDTNLGASETPTPHGHPSHSQSQYEIDPLILC